jgi:cytoskeletal protein RodZ
MDHQQQHHDHHRHEREEKKKEEKEFEHRQEKSILPIHPAWLMGIVAALILTAIFIWTFYF